MGNDRDTTEIIDRCIGGTGYIEIHADGTVKKYIAINEFYWAREYIIERYLSQFKHGGHACCDSQLEFKRVNNKYCAALVMPDYGRPITTAMLSNDASFLQLFLDVVRSLDIAHKAGVLHRDVKPENILVRDSHATLIDFGHALIKKAHGINLSMCVYTWMYRPPEVFQSKCYGPAADIWACGATFAALLTGQPIHHGMVGSQGTEASLAQYLNRATANMNTVREDLSKYFREFCKQHTNRTTLPVYFDWLLAMLSIESADRPTAAQLEHVILSFAQGLGIELECRAIHDQLITTRSLVNDDMCSSPTIHTYDEANNQQIMFLATNEAAYAIAQLNLPINLMACGKIIDHLVDCGTITVKNCRTMVVAILLLVANVIYDFSCTIRDATRAIPGIQKAALIKNMSTVLSVHMLDVFLERNFAY